jgi:hypothetical protein
MWKEEVKAYGKPWNLVRIGAMDKTWTKYLLNKNQSHLSQFSWYNTSVVCAVLVQMRDIHNNLSKKKAYILFHFVTLSTGHITKQNKKSD